MQQRQQKITTRLQTSFPTMPRSLLNKLSRLIIQHDTITTPSIYDPQHNRLRMRQLRMAVGEKLWQDIFPTRTRLQQQTLLSAIQTFECHHWDHLVMIMRLCFKFRERLVYNGDMDVVFSRDGITIDNKHRMLLSIQSEEILLNRKRITRKKDKTDAGKLFCQFLRNIQLISADKSHIISSIVLTKQRIPALKVQQSARLRSVHKTMSVLKYPNQQHQKLVFKAGNNGIPRQLAGLMNAPFVEFGKSKLSNLYILLSPGGVTTIPMSSNQLPQFYRYLRMRFEELFSGVNSDDKIIMSSYRSGQARYWYVFIPAILKRTHNNRTFQNPVLIYIYGLSFKPESPYFPSNFRFYILDLQKDRLYTYKQIMFSDDMTEISRFVRMALDLEENQYTDIHDNIGNVLNIRPVSASDTEFKNLLRNIHLPPMPFIQPH